MILHVYVNAYIQSSAENFHIIFLEKYQILIHSILFRKSSQEYAVDKIQHPFMI